MSICEGKIVILTRIYFLTDGTSNTSCGPSPSDTLRVQFASSLKSFVNHLTPHWPKIGDWPTTNVESATKTAKDAKTDMSFRTRD